MFQAPPTPEAARTSRSRGRELQTEPPRLGVAVVAQYHKRSRPRVSQCNIQSILVRETQTKKKKKQILIHFEMSAVNNSSPVVTDAGELRLSKVLVSDELEDTCLDILRSNGIEIIRKTKISQQELIKEIRVCTRNAFTAPKRTYIQV